jgi:hypothetical protein
MPNTYDSNPQPQLRELTTDEIEVVSGGDNKPNVELTISDIKVGPPELPPIIQGIVTVLSWVV